ncbi:hypothetical protein JCM3765_000047 [Sporobolomyces pararoseus]
MSPLRDSEPPTSLNSSSAALSTSSTQQTSASLAFSFSFYLPLGAPVASCFYSAEPLERTKRKTIEVDEDEWGNSSLVSKPEEEVHNSEDFINSAVQEATNLSKDQQGSEAVVSNQKKKVR